MDNIHCLFGVNDPVALDFLFGKGFSNPIILADPVFDFWFICYYRISIPWYFMVFSLTIIKGKNIVWPNVGNQEAAVQLNPSSLQMYFWKLLLAYVIYV